MEKVCLEKKLEERLNKVFEKRNIAYSDRQAILDCVKHALRKEME